MKSIVFGLTVVFLPFTVSAQGRIAFDTWIVRAPVTFMDGTLVGQEFNGQLYGGPAGTPVAELMPLLPVLPFFRPGYIVDGDLPVPGVFPQEEATIILRSFNGDSWETSTCRGESAPIIVVLASELNPPALLEGLQGFQVNCIPEPDAFALLGLGLLTIFWFLKR